MQIFQVKSRSANSYIIEENNRLMVIDVALRGEKDVVDYLTNSMNRNLQDVDLVACTHGHTDHMGGLRRLAGDCHADIGMPSSTSLWRERFCQLLLLLLPGYWLDRIASRFFNRKNLDLSILSAADKPDVSFTRLHPGASLPGFDNWLVIHTPGHTGDSCCYFHLPSKSLISGDTLLASGRTNSVLLPSIYSSRSKLEISIAELRDLDPVAIYPGHGSVLCGRDLLSNIVGLG
jgi:glyoxylase-like metal-dependent hydrolase (beta-lactamase superfamily II)